MKARIDAGTDAAMIAVWDASRDERALGPDDSPGDVLESDAAEGLVCVLRTNADGGGKIDVYVGESIEPEVAPTLREVPGRFLLSIPSGRLIVGGGEDYRSASPMQTSERSVVRVPAGDYETRWYAPTDTEREPRSEAALRKRVGADEVDYYDRTNRIGCIGGVTMLLLFPILLFPLGAAAALAITVVAFISFFPVRQVLLKRNERYQRLDKVIPAYRLANEDPYLVLTLSRVGERGSLRGGIASL